MSLEQLQKHKVMLLDAWRESVGSYYGFCQAVADGFMQEMGDSSASGYVPVDLWLSYNLKTRYEQIEKIEKVLIGG